MKMKIFVPAVFIFAWLSLSAVATVVILYAISSEFSSEFMTYLNSFISDTLSPLWNYLTGGLPIKLPDADAVFQALGEVERKRLIYSAAGVVGANTVIGASCLYLYSRYFAKKEAADCADLLVNMSHEIKTPINGIVGLAEAMCAGEGDAGRIESLSAIGVSGKALLRIIEDVLDIARLKAGRMGAERGETNIKEIIREAVSMMDAEVRNKGLCIRSEISPAIPDVVHSDGYKLMRVLVNLLGNAVKFTDSGSIDLTVDIDGAGRRRGDIHFCVRDTGPGIPKEMLGTMLAAQGKRGHACATNGTGLGLPISKGLVRLLGGELWAESSPGRGSSFHFTIST